MREDEIKSGEGERGEEIRERKLRNDETRKSYRFDLFGI